MSHENEMTTPHTVAELQHNNALLMAQRLVTALNGKMEFSPHEIKKLEGFSWKHVENHIETLLQLGLLEKLEGEKPPRYRLRMDLSFRYGALLAQVDYLDQQYYMQRNYMDYLCYCVGPFHAEVWETLALKFDMYHSATGPAVELLHYPGTTAAAADQIHMAAGDSSLVQVTRLPAPFVDAFIAWLKKFKEVEPVSNQPLDRLFVPYHYIKDWILYLIDVPSDQMFQVKLSFAESTMSGTEARALITKTVHEKGQIFAKPSYVSPLETSSENVRACRVCGCTEQNCSQCIEKTGQPCYWVEEDLCSACQEVPAENVAKENSNDQSNTTVPDQLEGDASGKGKIEPLFPGL